MLTGCQTFDLCVCLPLHVGERTSVLVLLTACSRFTPHTRAHPCCRPAVRLARRHGAHTQILTNAHSEQRQQPLQPGIARSHALLLTAASLIHLSLAEPAREKQPSTTAAASALPLLLLSCNLSVFSPGSLFCSLFHVIFLVCLAPALQS